MSFKISDNIIGFEEELSFFLNLYKRSAYQIQYYFKDWKE